jgi:hypothetical protein
MRRLTGLNAAQWGLRMTAKEESNGKGAQLKLAATNSKTKSTTPACPAGKQASAALRSRAAGPPAAGRLSG